MRITKVNGYWVLRGERHATWEPIEAAQIEEVRGHDEPTDCRLGGKGGAQALRWFQLGDTRSDFYQDPFGETPVMEAQATPWERAISWMRTLFGSPSPYRLVGC